MVRKTWKTLFARTLPGTSCKKLKKRCDIWLQNILTWLNTSSCLVHSDGITIYSHHLIYSSDGPDLEDWKWFWPTSVTLMIVIIITFFILNIFLGYIDLGLPLSCFVLKKWIELLKYFPFKYIRSMYIHYPYFLQPSI